MTRHAYAAYFAKLSATSLHGKPTWDLSQPAPMVNVASEIRLQITVRQVPWDEAEGGGYAVPDRNQLTQSTS